MDEEDHLVGMPLRQILQDRMLIGRATSGQNGQATTRLLPEALHHQLGHPGSEGGEALRIDKRTEHPPPLDGRHLVEEYGQPRRRLLGWRSRQGLLEPATRPGEEPAEVDPGQSGRNQPDRTQDRPAPPHALGNREGEQTETPGLRT